MGRHQPNQPPTRPVETAVTAVELYPDQVTVTRSGMIALAAGHHTLDLGELPAGSLPDSVRLAGQGTAVELVDVWAEVMAAAAENGDGALSTLEADCQQGQAAIAALKLQQAFLQTLAERAPHSFAQGLAQDQITLEETTAFLQFLGEEQQRLSLALTEAEQHHQIQTAQQHAALRQTVSPQRYRVQVTVAVAQATEWAFTWTYACSGMGWQPSYEARLNTQQQQVQLTLRGQIWPSCPAEWAAATLIFCLGQPATQAAPQPWQVRELGLSHRGRMARRPSVTTIPAESPRAANLEETYRMMGAVPGSELPTLASPPATEPLPPTPPDCVLSYRLPPPHPTLQQEIPHPLPIQRHTCPCDVVYVAYPQQAVMPFVQAVLPPDATLYPLLSGPLKLFRDQAYVGTTHLPLPLPGETICLPFGCDDRVSVEHRLQRHMTHPGRPRQDCLSYAIALHNQGDTPITCWVREYLPISQEDQIRIRIAQADPVVTQMGADQCEWRVTLPPQGSQAITFDLTIDSPGDTPVIGLDG